MTEPIRFRRATADDVPGIVALLAADPLGKSREHATTPLPDSYRRAFARMQQQPDNYILLAEQQGALVGCLQLTLISGLSRGGALRAQIEAVRVAQSHRGRGVGEALFAEALRQARDAGCQLAQLTTDTSRGDAHRFYERLGFAASHIGMKLNLDEA